MADTGMNADFLSGMAIGQFGRGATDAALSRVQGQNNRLKGLLARANEDVFLTKVQCNAYMQVLDMTLAALQAANPDSPLLNKTNRDALRRQLMNTELQKNGYSYDVATGTVDYKAP